MRTKGYPTDSSTRVRAIHRFCHDCMGREEHPKICTARSCSLRPYRPGIRARGKLSGRPAAIRQQCFECMGNWLDAKSCHDKTCALYPWRPGQKAQLSEAQLKQRAKALAKVGIDGGD